MTPGRGLNTYRGYRHARRTNAGLGAAAIAVIACLGACGGGNGTSSTQASAPPSPASTRSTTATSTTATSQPPDQVNRKESPGKLPGSPAAFVRAALTTDDPQLACSAYTDDALNKAYGGEAGCEAAVKSGGAADSVQIKDVHSGSQAATVSAVPSGGPSDGETVRIALVMDGGTWRIASLRSNVPVGP